MPWKQEQVVTPRDLVGGTDGFVGPINHTVGIKVDLALLTNKEIDADGYLKPYIPFQEDGTLVGVGDSIFGVSVEHIKVAKDNAAATIAALGVIEVAVVTHAVQLNRAIAEDVLDRVYSADELAAFATSRIVLIGTQA